MDPTACSAMSDSDLQRQHDSGARIRRAPACGSRILANDFRSSVDGLRPAKGANEMQTGKRYSKRPDEVIAYRITAATSKPDGSYGLILESLTGPQPYELRHGAADWLGQD